MRQEKRSAGILVFGACATITLCCMAPAAAQSDQAAKAGAMGACTLLTKDEIKQILGDRTPLFFDQFNPDEESLRGGAGSECGYSGVHIQLDPFALERFEEVRKIYAERATFERLGDVGEEAYIYEQDAGKSSHAVGIYARSKEHIFTIEMDVNAPETADSYRPYLVAMANTAVPKLH
jgi:hypothetical protein